jgi:multiple sugar transport system substrate-binding protein
MMKRALFFTLFIAILLLGTLPAVVAQEDFSGRSITFVTVQPHAVASRYVAQLFEAETGATVEVVDVPYDTIASQALLDVVSGVGQYDVIEIW